jgi:hypothetical protein
MASPFCTICERFGDTEGVFCCEAFPLGIPEAIYPWGCALRSPRFWANGLGFKARSGAEEIAGRWAENDPAAPDSALPDIIERRLQHKTLRYRPSIDSPGKQR